MEQSRFTPPNWESLGFENMKVGDKKKLQRQTFLYNGIFVLQGSTVEIKEIGECVTVEWHDQEGNPHLLDDVQEHELS